MTKKRLPVKVGLEPENLPAAAGPIAIEVYSDFVCPWCPIGERRLAKALELLGPLETRVTFRPYELNPDLPREGVDRRAYLTQKFGGLAAYERISARVVEAARGEGLAFALEKIERTASTRDAHRLSWLAAELGKQPPVVDGLFKAYFEEGRNLGDHAVLRDVATKAGLDAARVDALLAGDEGLEEVLALEARSRALGIDGVPCFVIDGVPAVAGAQDPETLARAIRAAVKRRT